MIRTSIRGIQHAIFRIAIRMGFFSVFSTIPRAIARTTRAFRLNHRLFFYSTVNLTRSSSLIGERDTKARATLIATTIRLHFSTCTQFAACVRHASAFQTVSFIAKRERRIGFRLTRISERFTRTLNYVGIVSGTADATRFTSDHSVLRRTSFIVCIRSKGGSNIIARHYFGFFRISGTIALQYRMNSFGAFTLRLATNVRCHFIFNFTNSSILTFFLVGINYAFSHRIIEFNYAENGSSFAQVDTSRVNGLVANSVCHFFDLPTRAIEAENQIAGNSIRHRGLRRFLNGAQIRQHNYKMIRVGQWFRYSVGSMRRSVRKAELPTKYAAIFARHSAPQPSSRFFLLDTWLGISHILCTNT